MKHKSTLLALSLIIVVSLSLLWALPSHGMNVEEMQDYLGELEKPVENPDADFISKQAEALAKRLPLSDEFAEELVEWYSMSKEIDFLLVYNTGGFGGSTMEDDLEWHNRPGGFLRGIQDELENLNCTSMVVEHQRAEYTTIGFTEAVKEMMNNYSTTAPELAAKVAFLTKYNPDLRVIITGRSTGAVFSSEVMQLVRYNSRVYSIQAGRMAGYDPEFEERTVLINRNNIADDALSNGDLWVIFKANLGHPPTTSPPPEGSMQILHWYLKAPGHAYTWELLHDEDQYQIIELLKSASESG